MDRVDRELVRRALAMEVPRGLHGPIDVTNARPAAVVVPIGEASTDAVVHFVVRAASMREHASEVGFPGGKVEASDASNVDAALREMEEEVAIPRARASVLGELSSVPVISGRYVIHPFVVALDDGIAPTIASTEVARLLTTPIYPWIEGDLRIHAVSLELDGGYRWLAPHFRIAGPPEDPAASDGYVLYGASAYVFYELLAKVARALGRELPPHVAEAEFPWGDRYK